MKTIEIDDQLYQYIASQTTTIGESASDILRRLLLVDQEQMAKSIEEASAAPAVKEQVARWAVTDELTAGSLVRVLPEQVFSPYETLSSTYAIFLKRELISPKIRVFLDFLTRALI